MSRHVLARDPIRTGLRTVRRLHCRISICSISPSDTCLIFYLSWLYPLAFFFSSRRRHTRSKCDWSSDVCSSDLGATSTHRPPPEVPASAGAAVAAPSAAKAEAGAAAPVPLVLADPLDPAVVPSAIKRLRPSS